MHRIRAQLALRLVIRCLGPRLGCGSWRCGASLGPPLEVCFAGCSGMVFFVGHFCCLLFVFVMIFCLFVASLWSPARRGLVSWLSCVSCFVVILSLSRLVSWVRCGT